MASSSSSPVSGSSGSSNRPSSFMVLALLGVTFAIFINMRQYSVTAYASLLLMIQSGDWGNFLAACVAVGGYLFDAIRNRKQRQLEAQMERVQNQSRNLLVPVTTQFQSLWSTLIFFTDSHFTLDILQEYLDDGHEHDDEVILDRRDAKAYAYGVLREYFEASSTAEFPRKLRHPWIMAYLVREVFCRLEKDEDDGEDDDEDEETKEEQVVVGGGTGKNTTSSASADKATTVPKPSALEPTPEQPNQVQHFEPASPKVPKYLKGLRRRLSKKKKESTTNKVIDTNNERKEAGTNVEAAPEKTTSSSTTSTSTTTAATSTSTSSSTSTTTEPRRRAPPSLSKMKDRLRWKSLPAIVKSPKYHLAITKHHELPYALHYAVLKCTKPTSFLWIHYEAFIRNEWVPALDNIASIIVEHSNIMEPLTPDRLKNLFGQDHNGYGQTWKIAPRMWFYSMFVAYAKSWTTVLSMWAEDNYSQIRPSTAFPIGLLLFNIQGQSLVAQIEKELIGVSQMHGHNK